MSWLTDGSPSRGTARCGGCDAGRSQIEDRCFFARSCGLRQLFDPSSSPYSAAFVSHSPRKTSRSECTDPPNVREITVGRGTEFIIATVNRGSTIVGAGGEDDNYGPAAFRHRVDGEFKAVERQRMASVDCFRSAKIDCRPPRSRSGLAASRRTQMDLQEIHGATRLIENYHLLLAGGRAPFTLTRCGFRA
jgi:hypothetical protein